MLGIAHDDDAGAVNVQMRGRKVLDLVRFDGLNIRDVPIDFVEAHAIERQRAKLRDQPAGRLEPAGEPAQKTRFARGQFAFRKVAGGQSGNLSQRQRRDFSARLIFCLRRGAKRTGPAAHVQAAAGAITQAPLHANLPVQAARVTTENCVSNDAAKIFRAAAIDRGSRRQHHSLARVRFVDH